MDNNKVSNYANKCKIKAKYYILEPLNIFTYFSNKVVNKKVNSKVKINNIFNSFCATRINKRNKCNYNKAGNIQKKKESSYLLILENTFVKFAI